jgi:geranylgeranyl transferase type-1 subunit beta
VTKNDRLFPMAVAPSSLPSSVADEIQKYASIYLFRCPTALESGEFLQMTLAYLATNTLAMLGRLDSAFPPARRAAVIDWVYSHQTRPPQPGGFRPSAVSETPNHTAVEAHLASTHNALGILLLLGDDLSRVDSPRVLDFVKSVQLPSGAFLGNPLMADSDLRFAFCAAAIARILGSSGEIDVEKAIEHVLDCQTHQGAFAYQPGEEGHGGATYCGLAALDLWGALDRIRDRNALAFWYLQCQGSGFCGRPHKDEDTCYSFWIGAGLRMLGWYDDIVDREKLLEFIWSNYDHGTFHISERTRADLTHTHFALAGLALAKFPGVDELHPALGYARKPLPAASRHHADLRGRSRLNVYILMLKNGKRR